MIFLISTSKIEPLPFEVQIESFTTLLRGTQLICPKFETNYSTMVVLLDGSQEVRVRIPVGSENFCPTSKITYSKDTFIFRVKLFEVDIFELVFKKIFFIKE